MIDPVQLLKRLIAVDSTSTLSNVPLIELLDGEVRALGFTTQRQVWRDAAGVEKANLVARRGGSGDAALAFVGHTDCVPFDPAWAGALAAEEKDGKLYGRGSADTKGFIAAALAAAARAPAAAPLALVFSADEEVGCLGAKKLVDEGLVRARHAVVGEPTRLVPMLGHKGYCLAEIEITGAEGHSAYPETGASAILAAGRLLADLERISFELEAEGNPLFSPPQTTLNVGMIQGGKAKNVIPGSCKLTLEWRPVPGQDVRRVLTLVEEACARATAGRIGAQVRASRLDAGVSVPRDSPIVQFLERESGHAAETVPFGTELPQLVALGADACVFGGGDIRVAHRTGEFIPLAELRETERILSAAIATFCK